MALDRPRWLLVTLSAALWGCELTEVTVAPGTRTVVVHSVISRTAATQFVIVEYSLTGDAVRGPTGSPLPPASPRFPIAGAQVTIAHLGPGPCTGRVDTLIERSVGTAGASSSGTYEAALCTLEPGDQLQLTVRTPDGRVVRGSTVVPGAAARRVRAGSHTVAPRDTLRLERTRDTLEIGVVPTSGRALQIEVRRAGNADDLVVYAFTDTMGIALAGNLVNPFEGDSGTSVFRAGRYYDLAIALTDSNYYDFVRSRSDPFTGRGFINRLDGGIGVFGSVEAATNVVRVTGPVDDPREGTYRMSGDAAGTALDLTLELYLDDLDRGAFAAFVAGRWFDGPLKLSADGWFGPPHATTGDPNEFTFTIELLRPGATSPTNYLLRGTRAANGAPFQVRLIWAPPGGTMPFEATLTARQIDGL